MPSARPEPRAGIQIVPDRDHHVTTALTSMLNRLRDGIRLEDRSALILVGMQVTRRAAEDTAYRLFDVGLVDRVQLAELYRAIPLLIDGEDRPVRRTRG